jgi:hypothetical protein
VEVALSLDSVSPAYLPFFDLRVTNDFFLGDCLLFYGVDLFRDTVLTCLTRTLLWSRLRWHHWLVLLRQCSFNLYHGTGAVSSKSFAGFSKFLN